MRPDTVGLIVAVACLITAVCIAGDYVSSDIHDRRNKQTVALQSIAESTAQIVAQNKDLTARLDKQDDQIEEVLEHLRALRSGGRND